MTVVIYDDPAAALVRALRDALAARTEPYAADVRVAASVPTDVSAYRGDRPLVVLVQDAPGRAEHRALNRVPMRGMAWHDTEDDTHDLAQLVHALVLNHSGPTVRSVVSGSSPYVTADPDSGDPLGSFTVTAHVRGRLA